MNLVKKIYVFSAVLLATAVSSVAAETAAESISEGRGMIALGAAFLLGIAVYGGTSAQGKAIASSLESIGRNPGASGKLFVQLLLGLALIESLVILSFVIANNLAGKI